jgi:hypothetical protein
VAFGQAGQLVVARHLDGSREVAGRDAIHGRGDRAQRPGQVGRDEVREQDRDDDRHRHREEEDPAERRVGLAARDGLGQVRDDPENGEGDDRPRDEGAGQPRAEREASTVRLVVAGVIHRRREHRRGSVDTRRRGP